MSNSFECEVRHSFITASELIEILAELIHEHGDLQVRIFDMDTESYTPIAREHDVTAEFIVFYTDEDDL